MAVTIDGTLGVTTPTGTGDVSVGDDLIFTGTGNRITGDFSNATIANRVMFQSSVTNGVTRIGAIPNGTSNTTAIAAFNSSDPNNASLLQISISATDANIVSNLSGTGTYLPMSFYTGGSERVRIDTSGNVGVGTSSPASRLHVVGAASTTAAQLRGNSGANIVVDFAGGGSNYQDASNHIFRSVDGVSERMRIDSSGNVGIGTFSPNFNAGVGTVCHINNANATGWALNHYTNGTTGSAAADGFIVGTLGTDGAYVFNYESSGLIFGTGALERARITNDGNLCVGTTTASGGSRLRVRSAGNTFSTNCVVFENSSAATLGYIRDDGAWNTGNTSLSPYNLTTGNAANVFVEAGGFLYRSTSSIKYKTDVQDANFGLADVLKLRPVTYKGKTDGDKVFGGLIAEEVHDAGLTQFVQYAEDGSPDALAYGNMVSLAFKAIQEQQSIIKSLQDRITALEQA